MKRIAIDFSRTLFKHRASAPRITFVSAVMYVMGIALLVALALACLDLINSEQKQHIQIQELVAKLHPPVQRSISADVQLSAEKTKAQSTAIQKLNLPWRDLLDTAERATPKNIALLSLEPDAGKNILLVVAESANSEAMLDYVSQLKGKDLFVDVRLVMHEINKQDPFAPYRFQIEARWREVVP
jgi:Tfp pilus assembly protein PilN